MQELSYTFPTEEIKAAGTYANPNITAVVDAESNLIELWNSLTAHPFCSNVRIGFRAYELGRPAGRLEPLVTSFYPVYQETIYGTEGVIVAQRVFTPFRAGYGDAVCWQLDLQAEGHRLIQIDVEIDWGARQSTYPIKQRYQDGLIVAQGGFSERATRVFGASGPPTQHDLKADGTAHLVYHVLIEGYIDLPFILSIAPSGEQLAWNGFLALSDLNLVFLDSNKQFDKVLETGEIVTPFPFLNRGLGWAKAQLFKGIGRGLAGIAFNLARDTHVDVATEAYAARALAWIEPDISREMLARMVKLAQASQGGIVAAYHHSSGKHQAAAGVDATTAFVRLAKHFLLVDSDDSVLHASYKAAIAWLKIQANVLDPSLSPLTLQHLAAFEQIWQGYEQRLPTEILGVPGAFDSEFYDLLKSVAGNLPAVERGEDKALVASAAMLLVAYEGMAGLTAIDDKTLLMRPNLPQNWPWFVLMNVAYGDRLINVIFHEGRLYSDHTLTSPLPLVECTEISRLPSERLALAVRYGGEKRVFLANPEANLWRGKTKAFAQQYDFELQPGEAQWL